jgi:hypothetical protein
MTGAGHQYTTIAVSATAFAVGAYRRAHTGKCVGGFMPSRSAVDTGRRFVEPLGFQTPRIPYPNLKASAPLAFELRPRGI